MMTREQNKSGEPNAPSREQPGILRELRDELAELKEQREAIDSRLREVTLQLRGLTDPEEIVEHDDSASKLEQELAELKSKYQRALADFQNYQRRSFENEKEAKRQGASSVLESLLTVLDNFELALLQDPTKATAEQVFKGVSVIRDEMMRVLGSKGMTVISVKPNDPFDPEKHQAVMQADVPGIQPGHVAAVLQSGYLLGDRVIRPAKVSVAPQRTGQE